VWRLISPKLWQGPLTSSCMQSLTTWSKSVETDKSCLTTVHNEYARDWHYWKNIPTPDLCLRGSMPETDCPDYKTYLRPLWEIRIQIIECDNTGSLYTSTPTHEGNTTIQSDVHRTNPLMSISWTNIAFIELTIPFEYKKKDLSCADFIEYLPLSSMWRT
jgi:hypothetical protein